MILAGRVLSRLMSDMPLGRKVALIPMLTLLLTGLMLALSVYTGVRNTAALRVLDNAVFEPLDQAQTLKDGITLLHTRLFALLSIGNNQVNPDAQTASAADLLARLETQERTFNAFLDGNTAIPPPLALRLRQEMAGRRAAARNHRLRRL